MNKQILTYSAARKFQVCHKAYHNRYLENLVPLEQDDALFLGSIIHECLEVWYKKEATSAEINRLIDEAYPLRDSAERQKRDWHLARAMMKGYRSHYGQEQFEVLETELEFRVPIINPKTGRPSQSFELMGKVDGLVRMGGEYFILEHKTAALITGDYIEKLPMDFQVNLYAIALGRERQIPIAGVIYNVIQKSKIRQRQGETEDQFELRRQDLIRKSKTGKTSAKRQIPESDEAFQKRLESVYAAPCMYARETLYLSKADMDRTEQELWEITQEILSSRRRKHWSQNTDSCFRYYAPCMYFPLCRAHDNPNIKENLYTKRPPHSELSVGESRIF
jgi:hypothetical protein